MIRVTTTPKPRDRFGSIPIRGGKPENSFSSHPHLPRRRKNFFLWTWLKRLVTLLLILTLLLGFGSPLLVPYLASTLLAEALSSSLNRSVTIPRGEFNPISCTLTLHHLIVGPNRSRANDPVDPLLSAEKTTIAFAPKRVLEGELAFTLSAEHCFLHLVRQQDGNYNTGQAMADLLTSAAVIPLRFSCKTVAISDSRLVFDDAQSGKTHRGEDISLLISSGATGSAPASPFRLQATLNGIPISQDDTTGLTANPGQAPAPAEAESEEGQPATPDDPAAKATEAIALVRDLSQAGRQYLQNPIKPPVVPRPAIPIAH
ncbi:DUF748 domain-containing protein [Thiovibrio frasassiensis]|uniref:AsmA domain-containing protein n=1 Tax=Thiovibrio frasassiensis TaxID=2984131 RepID=A0A9X4MF49_9BACT|nr:hypothetical protein [Thiovibrio frasassiensis]MDG4476101.1 hypothetical protein [Thiovibrio frasassiensis]